MGGVYAALNTNLLLFGQRQDAVCAREFDVGVTVHPLPDLGVEQPLGAADAGWEPRPQRPFITPSQAYTLMFTFDRPPRSDGKLHQADSAS